MPQPSSFENQIKIPTPPQTPVKQLHFSRAYAKSLKASLLEESPTGPKTIKS
jgi:hypothetical protein